MASLLMTLSSLNSKIEIFSGNEALQPQLRYGFQAIIISTFVLAEPGR